MLISRKYTFYVISIYFQHIIVSVLNFIISLQNITKVVPQTVKFFKLVVVSFQSQYVKSIRYQTRLSADMNFRMICFGKNNYSRWIFSCSVSLHNSGLLAVLFWWRLLEVPF